MKQQNLFLTSKDDNNLLEKFEAALLFSAIGDSLGWPLEFKKKKLKKRIESFIKWKKLVGGKWWGYEDEISPGEYSDDTQLTLSIARSIRSNGEFDANYFAYLELPLWLHYERGGGEIYKICCTKFIEKEKFLVCKFL